PPSPLFPYTTLFRSSRRPWETERAPHLAIAAGWGALSCFVQLSLPDGIQVAVLGHVPEVVLPLLPVHVGGVQERDEESEAALEGLRHGLPGDAQQFGRTLLGPAD